MQCEGGGAAALPPRGCNTDAWGRGGHGGQKRNVQSADIRKQKIIYIDRRRPCGHGAYLYAYLYRSMDECTVHLAW